MLSGLLALCQAMWRGRHWTLTVTRCSMHSDPFTKWSNASGFKVVGLPMLLGRGVPPLKAYPCHSMAAIPSLTPLPLIREL